MSIAEARTVADAVLYEGYLLYPYRATSGKNLMRWQFGVLGPHGAEAAGLGEDSQLQLQCLLRTGSLDSPADPDAALTFHVRFLQVQHRRPQRRDDDRFVDVQELAVGDERWYGWDEAVAVEHSHTVSIAELAAGASWTVVAAAGEEIEALHDDGGAVVGRLVRERRELLASAAARLEPASDLRRLTFSMDNLAEVEDLGRDEVIRSSLVSTHVIIESVVLDSGQPSVTFVSVMDPPLDAAEAAASCRQHRCWPVLAGPAGDESMLLGSPIILYDHPEIAGQSMGALFDSTEIDEILTLRVMTMTDQEKAEARATDPKAAEIIDRCDRMTVEELQQLHGILRDPHLDGLPEPEAEPELDWFDTGDQPWWDPATDERVQPEVDAVLINGVSVSKGSLVRVHPSRRADAQDLFFADQVARVTQVLADVDGEVHVAVVLVDDPAADLHDWYGRYLYFATDELEPLSSQATISSTFLPGKES